MIILEGPDGAGKTTLLHNLVETFGFDVGMRSTDNRDLLYTVTRIDTWKAVGTELTGAQESPLLWDRLFFSDYIYAPLSTTPRPVAFSPAEKYQFVEVLRAIDAPVIWCRPPWAVVEENELGENATRHQMAGVRENLAAIYDGYAAMEAEYATVLNSHFFDYTREGDYAKICKAIKHYQVRRSARNVNRDLAALENNTEETA